MALRTAIFAGAGPGAGPGDDRPVNGKVTRFFGPFGHGPGAVGGHVTHDREVTWDQVVEELNHALTTGGPDAVARYLGQHVSTIRWVYSCAEGDLSIAVETETDAATYDAVFLLGMMASMLSGLVPDSAEGCRRLFRASRWVGGYGNLEKPQ